MRLPRPSWLSQWAQGACSLVSARCSGLPRSEGGVGMTECCSSAADPFPWGARGDLFGTVVSARRCLGPEVILTSRHGSRAWRSASAQSPAPPVEPRCNPGGDGGEMCLDSRRRQAQGWWEREGEGEGGASTGAVHTGATGPGTDGVYGTGPRTGPNSTASACRFWGAWPPRWRSRCGTGGQGQRQKSRAVMARNAEPPCARREVSFESE